LKNNWTKILMVLGFGLAIVCFILMRQGNYSESINILLGVGKDLGIGIGSIGIGGYFSGKR
jgi:hypothetical protein